MALTKVSGGILDPGINVAGIVTATGFDGPFIGGSSKNITAGIITATGFDLNGNGDISGNLVIGGNLTANGDFTTLNTTLREVEILRVDANSSEPAGIITQTGAGDLLRLYDGSSQVVTVDDTGNIGVGINSPSTKLQVHGGLIKISGHAYARVTVNDGANEAFFGFENQGPLLIGNANADAQIRVQGTNDIFFQTGNTVKRLSIKGDTGNVGIGSEIPSAKLDVNGTSKFQGIVNVGVGLTLGDNVPASFGDSNDLQIVHQSGENHFLLNSNTFFKGTTAWGVRTASNQTIIGTNAIGRTVELYGGTINVLSTAAAGVTIRGGLYIENAEFNMTTNGSKILDFETGGTNTVTFRHNPDGGAISTFMQATHGGSLKFYDDADGNKKFETFSQGILTPNTLGICFGDGGCKVSGIAGSGASAGIFFMTNSGGKWQITGDGHFIPSAVGSYNIGSSGAEVGNVYIADSGSLYVGSDQDIRIWHNSGTGNGNISNGSGNLYINATSTHEVGILVKANNSVDLYYDSSTYSTPKLKTSATGITVTGEVSASQDYPNFRPVLDFNFAATKKLKPEMTFARVGEASFHDGVGSVKFVSDNEPRFEHDIVTGECKGLMFEGAGTNYSWHSRRFYSSSYPAGSWVPINGGATPTITENTHTAPDGTSSGIYMADTITGATGTTVSGNVVRQQWTAGTSVKHTVSIYVKLITATQATIYLRDANTGSTQSVSAIPNTRNWQRLVVTSSSAMTASVTHSWFIGNTNGTIALWGSQIERSDYVSSYIKTDAAANGTRTADDGGVRLDGEDVTDVFNQGEGTLIAEAIPTNSITNQGLVGFYQDFGSVNRIEVRTQGSSGSTANARFESVVGSSSVVTNTSSPHAGINNVSKYAFAFQENNYASTVNGGTVQTDTNGAFPHGTGINSMIIGDSVYSQDASVIIKRIMYYADRLPDSQLVTLTS